ncbi:hypothetical protein GLOIN_2v236328 [Rhizophagus irregularis DAOM 181602=DAOM 197198]|nr:hypothetical protein GLOIN_2v236328 [Rhizophagus irregularis DAOM 181602=DAOM 197198]
MTKQIIVSPNKERIQIFELIKTMIISITNIFLAFIEASPLFASATKKITIVVLSRFSPVSISALDTSKVQHLILDYVGPNNKNQKKFWDHLDSDMLKKFWDYLFIKMNLARIQIFIVDFNSAINGCECLL